MKIMFAIVQQGTCFRDFVFCRWGHDNEMQKRLSRRDSSTTFAFELEDTEQERKRQLFDLG